MKNSKLLEKLGFNSLRVNLKIIAIIIISTLLLVIDSYHSFFPLKSLDRLFLYLVIPIMVLGVFRESPANYGFRIGDWKTGLLFTFAGALGMSIIILVIARTGDFQSYYSPYILSKLPYPIDIALDLFGWEFFFRGFLLFSLYQVCGPYAIILQAVPFTIAHIGKPEVETLSCIFGGSAFGYLAWRTKSFFYPFILHWYISTLTITIAAGL